MRVIEIIQLCGASTLLTRKRCGGRIDPQCAAAATRFETRFSIRATRRMTSPRGTGNLGGGFGWLLPVAAFFGILV